MLTKGDASFEIAGHTDSVGAKERNLILSQKRAEKIRMLLVVEGMDSTKIKAVGYGESQPVANNKSKKGRSTNRRIEIYVIQN